MRSDAVNIDKLKYQVHVIRALPLMSEYPLANLQIHPKTRGITQTGDLRECKKLRDHAHFPPFMSLRE